MAAHDRDCRHVAGGDAGGREGCRARHLWHPADRRPDRRRGRAGARPRPRAPGHRRRLGHRVHRRPPGDPLRQRRLVAAAGRDRRQHPDGGDLLRAGAAR
nr:hypothetical protein [Angustibacter aerolatus]